MREIITREQESAQEISAYMDHSSTHSRSRFYTIQYIHVITPALNYVSFHYSARKHVSRGYIQRFSV